MHKILFALMLIVAQGVFAEQGVLVYADSSRPVSRLFNDSFGLVLNTSVDMVQDVAWVVGRANHERDEFVFGFVDTKEDLTIQVFNGSWGNVKNLTVDLPNSNRRAFDIVVEDVSGDVLVVYENSSKDDAVIAYRVWNGSFSDERLIEGVDDAVHWIRAVPRKGSNDVLVVTLDDKNDMIAMLWNGTSKSIENSTKVNVTFSSSILSRSSFDVVWESNSGEALLVFGEGSVTKYMTFVNNSWSASQMLFDWGGGSADEAVLCASSDSDRIGWIGKDSQDDVNVRVWNGSGVEVSPVPPSEDASTEGTVTSAQNVFCAWSGEQVVFVFVDAVADDQISFVIYNGSWSNVSLDSPSRSQVFDGDGTAIENLRLAVSSGKRVMTQMLKSGNNQITMAEWNVSEWLSNVSLGSVCGQGGNPTNCAYFVWDEYDAVPAVVPENRSLRLFAGQVIFVGMNVSDANLESVVVNVSLPSGVVDVVVPSNVSRVFSMNFSYVVLGNYSLMVVANDSSTHRNLNASEIIRVEVVNSIPIVQNVTVIPISAFQGSTVTFQANASDILGIDKVVVEINFPNGSLEVMSMLNISRDVFVINISAIVLGVYSARVVANDSFGAMADSTVTFVVNATGSSSANSSVNSSEVDEEVVDEVKDINRRRAFEKRVAPSISPASESLTFESEVEPIEIDAVFLSDNVMDETVEVVKGVRESFSIFVNHSYENVSLENVSLVLKGETAQFMAFSPDILEKVVQGNGSFFVVSVFVPLSFSDSFDTVAVEIHGVLVKRVREVVAGRVVRRVVLEKVSVEEVVQVLITSPPASVQTARMTYIPMEEKGWGWLIILSVLLVCGVVLRKEVRKGVRMLVQVLLARGRRVKKRKVLVGSLKDVYGESGGEKNFVVKELESSVVKEEIRVSSKNGGRNRMRASDFYRRR